jgi:hypothetical protein
MYITVCRDLRNGAKRNAVNPNLLNYKYLVGRLFCKPEVYSKIAEEQRFVCSFRARFSNVPPRHFVPPLHRRGIKTSWKLAVN